MPVRTGSNRPPDPWPESLESPVRPKKRLGQHFLTNRGVLRQILAAAELTQEECVIEVGPGMGILTRELAQLARTVVAVELDGSLVERLREALGQQTNVRLIQGDVLSFPPAQLLGLLQTNPTDLLACGSYKVVANLPYYITAPVLRHFLAGSLSPSRMVVMVQYEVAKSIVAKPGDMGLLAIAVQYYGRPELVAVVSPGSFAPPPKVKSAILRIDTYPHPQVHAPSTAAFFDAVRAGFSTRRKQLHNTLAHVWGISSPHASALLDAAGVDPQRRAQSLSLEEWAQVAWARERSLQAA